jgi:hypothetical protein
LPSILLKAFDRFARQRECLARVPEVSRKARFWAFCRFVLDIFFDLHHKNIFSKGWLFFPQSTRLPGEMSF